MTLLKKKKKLVERNLLISSRVWNSYTTFLLEKNFLENLFSEIWSNFYIQKCEKQKNPIHFYEAIRTLFCYK